MRHLSILVLSWKLAEDFGMVMDMTMLMYLVMAEQICSAAAAVGYCCCCRLFLLLQRKCGNLLLPIHTLIRCFEYLRHTAAAQTAYIITYSRSIQVELGKVEGFRVTEMLKWMLTSHIKYQAASSLALYATWTNQLEPSCLTLWISSVYIKDPSACTI